VFRRKLTAKTYPEMFRKQLAAAKRNNGVAANGAPRLTNDGVLQLVDYWRLAAKKAGHPRWSEHFETYVRGALGFFREGDKFKIDTTHARKLLPDKYLNEVWGLTAAPLPKGVTAGAAAGARGFQGMAALVPGPVIPFRPTAKTVSRFKRHAALSWARLKLRRAARKATVKRKAYLLPTTIVTAPGAKVIRRKKTKPIPWWIWLLLVAVATSNQR
jgi:hypothetical protein